MGSGLGVQGSDGATFFLFFFGSLLRCADTEWMFRWSMGRVIGSASVADDAALHSSFLCGDRSLSSVLRRVRLKSDQSEVLVQAKRPRQPVCDVIAERKCDVSLVQPAEVRRSAMCSGL